MSRERFERVDEIFRAAVRRPSASRAAFLDEACGDDAALRAEVEALLAEDGAARGALDAPVLGAKAVGPDSPVRRAADAARGADDSVAEHDGRIGPYRLLQQIGEGGFGVVFMAEQDEPVRRRVALKVIKLGMDTRQVTARFEAERQALALMDHPHIATVLDAGATERGRPYFVMELSTGTPITDYCREHRLAIPARLELAVQVCRAVQHAHQKGVIHRDIKPGNVLVETRDGRPFARVIDFGIAKATEARLTERTYFTEHRQMIGTPEYMSPEQAEGLTDVDTRTDVYALGVMLYELLTGTTPHDPAALRSAAWGEIQRIIREIEPPPPSTRRTRAGRRPPPGAAAGDDDPVAPPRGELDWIVMKALAKERDRRYPSAGELAADLEHHLEGRPVSAAPPSRAYQARTFMRRHRGLVAASAAIAAALVAGVVGTGTGLLRALDAREAADAAAREAETRAEQLETVARFQASQLSDVDPAAVGTRMRGAIEERLPPEAAEPATAALDAVNFTSVALETLRADILQPALDAARSELADQPRVRARLSQSLADAGRELGLLEFAEAAQLEALELRERMLGTEHPDTLWSLASLVVLRIEQSRPADAVDVARRSVELHRRVLGDSVETLDAISAYGSILRALERLEEALPYYEEAYEGRRRLHGPDDPGTLVTLSNLGFINRALGRLDEAADIFRRTYEARRRLFGPDDSRTLSSMINYAGSLRTSGRFVEAEPLYVTAVEGHRRLHGDEHPRTLISLSNLGLFYVTAGRPDEALPILREAVDGSVALHGAEAVWTVVATINLGRALTGTGALDEAEATFSETLRIAQSSFGPESPWTFRSELGLASVLRARGATAAAVVRLEDLAARAVAARGPEWGLAQEIDAALVAARGDAGEAGAPGDGDGEGGSAG